MEMQREKKEREHLSADLPSKCPQRPARARAGLEPGAMDHMWSRIPEPAPLPVGAKSRVRSPGASTAASGS